MDISPTTCRTLEQYYHVNSNTLDKQYKDVLSDYRTWSELEHADEWLVFPDNVGRNLAIDETSMSNSEFAQSSPTGTDTEKSNVWLQLSKVLSQRTLSMP